MAEELPCCFVVGLHSDFGQVIPFRVAKEAMGQLELLLPPWAQVQRAIRVVAKVLVAAKVQVVVVVEAICADSSAYQIPILSTAEISGLGFRRLKEIIVREGGFHCRCDRWGFLWTL